MRLLSKALAAFVFCFALSGCGGATGLPGMQTTGLEPDPQRAQKIVIATAGLAVDGVGVYGRLPDCTQPKEQFCRNPKKYTDVKLIAGAVANDMELLASDRLSTVVAGLILAGAQYQMAKTIADQPGPTNPDAPPADKTLRYLDAIRAADIMANTFDERVKAAASVNTSVADLLADLNVRVAALP